MSKSTKLARSQPSVAILTPQDNEIKDLVGIARRTFPQLAKDDIPDESIAMALINCRLNSLNPFAKQVHLLPHRNSDGSVVVAAHPSIDTLVARARQATPQWFTSQCGLIIQRQDGTVVKEPGEVQKTPGTIIGAYCDVTYTNGQVVTYEVPITQYQRQIARWRQIGHSITHMLTKCALAHACRRNGAGENLYLVEELEVSPPPETPPQTPPKITVHIPPQTTQPNGTQTPQITPTPQEPPPPVTETQTETQTQTPESADQPVVNPDEPEYLKTARSIIHELLRRAPFGTDDKGRVGPLVDVIVRGKPVRRAFCLDYIELCAQRGWHSTAEALVAAAKRVIEQCPPLEDVEKDAA